MSGQVGISRVKAGDIFFGPFFVVTLLHQFFRFWSLFPVLASSLRLTQTPDSLRSSGGWGAECRVWTVNVGSGRSKSIQVDPGRGVFFFLAFVWLGLRAVGHWFVAALLVGPVMGGRFVKGSISRIWWVFG